MYRKDIVELALKDIVESRVTTITNDDYKISAPNSLNYTINSLGGNDTIELADTISKESLLYSVDKKDLTITLKDNPSTKVTIKGFFNEGSLVENLKFSDGTTLDLKSVVFAKFALNLDATLDEGGALSLKPNLNYHGSDSITIKVTNEYGLSDTKTIRIDVAPVNDAPEFKEESSTYELKNTSVISSALEVFDVDGDALSYKIIKNPDNGSLSLDKSGKFTFTKHKDFIGNDSAIIEVSDGKPSSTKELVFNSLGYKVDETSPDITIAPSQNVSKTLNLANSSKENLGFMRHKDALIIQDTAIGLSVTLKECFSSAHSLKEIGFKDGTTINISNDNLATPSKQWWQIRAKAKLDSSGVIFSNQDNAKLYGSSANDTIISLDNDTVNAGDGNDTLIAQGYNSTLSGENGNDRYIITKDANNTIIKDKELINLKNGGDDTVEIQGAVKESISFSKSGAFMQDLVVKYGDDNHTLTIKNHSNTNSRIESIKLDDGSFISLTQINKIIEEVNSCASDNGMGNFTHEDVKNNVDIMQIYDSGWGA